MKVAVAIPTYNNAGTLLAVVTQVLKVHKLVIVVDDGSTDETKSILESIKDRVHVLSHIVNHGKGAALATAFSYAQKLGLSHVLSFDADGQHDAKDIVPLVETLNGHELVIGVRNMSPVSGDVPQASLFGRAFSNYWVWLETGLRLSDTQSGLRIYPLSAVGQLKLHCQRYDFEIELLVRLLWAGVAVREIMVSVYYPPRLERVSHFHQFKDNLRLSILHTKLCIMAPWQRWLRNKRAALTHEPTPKVAKERRGARLMGYCFSLLGHRLCSKLMPLILIYYYLSAVKPRAALRSYYRRLGYAGNFQLLRLGFVNFYYFASCLLDRIAMARGARPQFSCLDDTTPLHNGTHGGAILVGAHYGEWVLSGQGLGLALTRPVCIVMNPHLGPKTTAQYQSLLAEGVRIIDATLSGLSIALAVHEAVASGALVCFLVDRPEAGAKAFEATFLGAKARFSLGPFSVAKALGCPIYSFHCLRTNTRALPIQYAIRLKALDPGNSILSALQLGQKFVRELEAQVRKQPEQWYNFYDFWQLELSPLQEPLSSIPQPHS